MIKEITLSNTTTKYFKLSYRIPGDPLKILEVEVIACALNVKIGFPNEEYYNEFKKQNAHYFDGDMPILIEGKTNSKKLEKINEKVESETRKVIDKELSKVDDTIEKISKQKTGKTIKLRVKKGGEAAWE